jgi:NAD(P) transhydrogenase
VGVQAALAAASAPYSKRVCLIDAPRESGVLMHEDEDLSIGAPTGLFGKALRDTSKRIKVSTLRGMGLREDSIWNEIMSSCVDLASSNAQDIRRRLEEAGIEYVEGLSSFADDGGSHSLLVSKPDFAVETISADKILIATGSTPFRQGGVPFDGNRIFDSDSINQVNLNMRGNKTMNQVIQMGRLTICSLAISTAWILAAINCHYRKRHYRY